NLQSELFRDFVAQWCRAHFWNRESACCNHERRRTKFFSVCPDHEFSSFRNFSSLLVQKSLHAGRTALRLEHLRDVARGVVTEKLAQCFFVIGNLVLLDECDEVLRQVASQSRFRKMW